jgi:hypothetical protein
VTSDSHLIGDQQSDHPKCIDQKVHDHAGEDGLRALVEVGEQPAQQEHGKECGDLQMEDAEDCRTDDEGGFPAVFFTQPFEDKPAKEDLFDYRGGNGEVFAEMKSNPLINSPNGATVLLMV